MKKKIVFPVINNEERDVKEVVFQLSLLHILCQQGTRKLDPIQPR